MAAWRGCMESGVMAGDATAPDDYDRACAVDDLAGVITVGENGAQALVPADEPATSCYLPERRAFLRWLAADSEAALKAAAEAVLADPATEWDECGTWVSDGPAVLMDSAEAGPELDIEYPGGGMPDQAPVPLPAGRWRVRATSDRRTRDPARPATPADLPALRPPGSSETFILRGCGPKGEGVHHAMHGIAHPHNHARPA